jgi:hypothetical protein
MKHLMPSMILVVYLSVAVGSFPGASAAQSNETVAVASPPEPTEIPELESAGPFFPDAQYDPGITSPESLLGFPIGKRAAKHAEIERCLVQWDEESPRMQLVEYARTYEGRSLYYMIVTSPRNHERLGEIKEGVGRLADPRGLGSAAGEQLAESLPAVAWLAYSIHGNEASGSDASLAVLYHLAAARGDEIDGMLEDVVVLIDPMMNPDGRDRFLKQVAEHRGTSPSLDDQSLLHAEYWPWGRMNHYLFDLNRDWVLGVNPEARGRIAAAGSWHPLLFVDAHEMGAQDTYLFSPSRDPRNPHFPERRAHWAGVFSRDQAAAFDRFGWPYYTGEWNEGWYPGYSDAWATFRGAIGILYEQASIGEDAVRRPGGQLLTYHESVHHQAVSSMANLATFHANADALKREFLEERRRAVSRSGPYSERTFAVLPSDNASRRARFLDLMRLQGFDIWETTEEITTGPGKDRLGRPFSRRTLPAGTVLIPNRQPEAHLVAAMFEFDSPMPDDYLKRERKEILKRGQSTIYDVTAWNLPMMHDVETLEITMDLPADVVKYEDSPAPEPLSDSEDAIAYVIDGADDRSVVAAARLLERGVEVHIADRAIHLDGKSFARGSVVVRVYDNAPLDVDASAEMAKVAGELGLGAVAISKGLGEGDLIDIGGEHFVRLEPPRIALVARAGISAYDFGSIWHMLDQRFAVRHSHLDEEFLSQADLRRYNVLVLPERWLGRYSEELWPEVRKWVESGGTLIAIGSSTRPATRVSTKLGHTRVLEDVLDRLDQFDLAATREWMAHEKILPDKASIWTHSVRPGSDYPWGDPKETGRPGKDELEKRDSWDQMFMPQGVMLAARTDDEHWLTFGSGEYLPVLYGTQMVLMASDSVEAPIRLGYLDEDPAEKEARRVGWATLPAGQTMYLRMSGLLWPEAAGRLASAPWVTRERIGRGQVILFATPPAFRASTLGTARILANALIYGPGMGASTAIEP